MNHMTDLKKATDSEPVRRRTSTFALAAGLVACLGTALTEPQLELAASALAGGPLRFLRE